MLFICILILSAIMFYLFYQITVHHKDDSKSGYAAWAIAAVNILFAVVHLFSGGIGAFSKGYILLGVSSALMYLLNFAGEKFPSRTLHFAVKAVAVASILEVTLFNLSTYRLWSGDYPELHFAAANIGIESGGSYDANEGVIHIDEGKELVAVLENVNIPIGTVYTEAVFSDDVKAGNYVIDIKDETATAKYRYNIIKTHIIKDRPNSAYLHIETSGNISDIRVKIQAINHSGIDVRSISLNVPIPLNISWFRFLFIVIISCFFYALFHEEILQKPFSECRRHYAIIASVITCITCVIGISMWSLKIDDDDKETLWKLEKGNQVTQELVDAFEEGSVSLLTIPDDDVINFDGIYDYSQRSSTGIRGKWDHVFYDGKYYSYYGIAPVILLFLPYHLLTGYYFPISVAVLLFSIIGLIGLTALYSQFIHKFFPSLSVGDAVVCLILAHAASGIWHSLARIDFYENATASGFAALTWGVFFLLSANIIGHGKISLPKTAVSSFLIALSVLCRPTLALYCVCAFAFFLMALKRPSLKGRTLIYLLCAITPMAALGLTQMWYNYARFGSPFEFGIQYSITINNFTATEYHWQLSLITLFNYLFNTPVFTPSYPFIQTELQQLDIGGYFYFDNPQTYSTSGIFWIALPIFSYFLSKRAIIKLPDRKAKLSALTYIGFPCVIIPLIIIALIWESGYATRYIADFGWEMLFGAYAILFFLYIGTSNSTIKQIIRKFLCFSMLWAIIVGGVQIYGQTFRFYSSHYEFPEFAYDLENLFQFWK